MARQLRFVGVIPGMCVARRKRLCIMRRARKGGAIFGRFWIFGKFLESFWKWLPFERYLPSWRPVYTVLGTLWAPFLPFLVNFW